MPTLSFSDLFEPEPDAESAALAAASVEAPSTDPLAALQHRPLFLFFRWTPGSPLVIVIIQVRLKRTGPGGWITIPGLPRAEADGDFALNLAAHHPVQAGSTYEIRFGVMAGVRALDVVVGVSAGGQVTPFAPPSPPKHLTPGERWAFQGEHTVA